MARIQGVPARICTWELVTGFGQNLAEESLMEFFHRDFPEVEKTPKFWKMVSFNSSEGRHHRYLVILADRKNQRGGRELPASLFLFACADEQMRSREGHENFRYAAIVDGVLYILVFYEGRLCHWSEERGYGGPQGTPLALERLAKMDEFLHQDPLFSQASSFCCGNLEKPDVNFQAPADSWMLKFRKATRDPFWKGLHLEPRRPWKRFALSIILFFSMMTVGFLAWKNLDTGCGKPLGPEAPMLTPPATEPISKKTGPKALVKGRLPRNGTVAPECVKPALVIQGIIGSRLFSGEVDGERVMKRTGDSLGAYRVKSVLRERVVLECGGREWEVLNGATF